MRIVCSEQYVLQLYKTFGEKNCSSFGDEYLDHKQ